jgi:hypothetical protein
MKKSIAYYSVYIYIYICTHERIQLFDVKPKNSIYLPSKYAHYYAHKIPPLVSTLSQLNYIRYFNTLVIFCEGQNFDIRQQNINIKATYGTAVPEISLTALA